jgi:hypothetical protein
LTNRHLPLGPFLWRRVDSATALDGGARTAWDQGVVSAAEAFDQPRSGFGALQIAAAAVVAVFAGEFAGDGLLLRVAIRIALALGAYWLVPTAWAVVIAIKAPVKQRNEARKQWRLEQVRANDLQERLERPALVRSEIEELQIALSGIQQSIEHNRSDDVTPQTVESVENEFERIRVTLTRHGISPGLSPFDQSNLGDIGKAALLTLLEEARRTLGEINGSLSLTLGVLHI